MDLVKLPLILTIFFLLLSIANTETIEVRNALVHFMQKLSPRNNAKEPSFGWNTTSDPCNDNWKGVSCYNSSSTIKKIVLDELNLVGQLDASSLCVTRSLTVLSLNSNNIFGTFSEEISKCTRLTHIYLHGNKFSGNLPKSLTRLSNLKRLDVSDNGFSGDIPDVSRISGLLTFLAENNQLNGSIPNFDFSNLQKFNVSNNNLSGTIPDLGGYFNETSFFGNRGLCGKPLVESCPLPPPQKKNDSSKKDYLIYSGFGAMGIVIICLIAFTLIKKGKNKKKKYVHDKVSSTSSESKGAREYSITSAESAESTTSPSLIVVSTLKGKELKFEDLLQSPAELITRGKHGSLYKVTTLEGLNLAVKRLRHWDISRDDFKKRMVRIDKVKHPNVIPLVAFYCSKQEKLLVCEFQQNGSLFSILLGSKNGQSFDWGSRLNVAAKISEALAFMHEGLQADGIAHGNLKSSNILMNNQMEPCLSEYGLVEIENQDRSFLAQIESFEEHGSQMNAFGADIYGFGVILLELLTGKLVQNNGFDLGRWVNSAIREEWTVEVFDKELVLEGANEERMVSLLQVALKCINSSSEARPRIKEVAVMINTIKEYEEKSITSDT
ncbi:hypothetical protein ACJIZ3_009911 [Penstemon smallii]|uniref:Protein kinase domain-containing protein n=1 Tax=Penstemon smallii TaxID=265156 RepID=A0ABD3TDV1_9LAMI